MKSIENCTFNIDQRLNLSSEVAEMVKSISGAIAQNGRVLEELVKLVRGNGLESVVKISDATGVTVAGCSFTGINSDSVLKTKGNR